MAQLTDLARVLLGQMDGEMRYTKTAYEDEETGYILEWSDS